MGVIMYEMMTLDNKFKKFQTVEELCNVCSDPI